jgi:hydrogenase/urease accessory protein HupE
MERLLPGAVYESRPELQVAVSNGWGGRAVAVAWPLFRLGIQHILTGYDHLLFLFGLILVSQLARPY